MVYLHGASPPVVLRPWAAAPQAWQPWTSWCHQTSYAKVSEWGAEGPELSPAVLSSEKTETYWAGPTGPQAPYLPFHYLDFEWFQSQVTERKWWVLVIKFFYLFLFAMIPLINRNSGAHPCTRMKIHCKKSLAVTRKCQDRPTRLQSHLYTKTSWGVFCTWMR